MLCCNNIVRRLVNCQPPELQCVSTWSFPKGLGTLPLSHDQLHLLGDPLQRVEYYKYLGLLISNNVSWLMHITATCSKVKQILGLLYRRFYGSACPDTLQLYLSMVRPHLDYACQIWDPHLAKDRKKNWRMCKSLPVGWHLTNGILATMTYFNCMNYHPWRSVGCT